MDSILKALISASRDDFTVLNEGMREIPSVIATQWLSKLSVEDRSFGQDGSGWSVDQ